MPDQRFLNVFKENARRFTVAMNEIIYLLQLHQYWNAEEYKKQLSEFLFSEERAAEAKKLQDYNNQLRQQPAPEPKSEIQIQKVEYYFGTLEKLMEEFRQQVAVAQNVAHAKAHAAGISSPAVHNVINNTYSLNQLAHVATQLHSAPAPQAASQPNAPTPRPQLRSIEDLLVDVHQDMHTHIHTARQRYERHGTTENFMQLTVSVTYGRAMHKEHRARPTQDLSGAAQFFSENLGSVNTELATNLEQAAGKLAGNATLYNILMKLQPKQGASRVDELEDDYGSSRTPKPPGSHHA